jgi:threonine aldolase
MFCLSKGLGAPVGSLLVGDRDAITEAHRIRKMLGGGMRQAGVLAAAALVALDEVLPRLGEDNRLARRLADRLAEIQGVVLDPETVDTNIVFFGVADSAALNATALAARLADEGILAHALGPDSIRMVTHYHISEENVDDTAAVVARVIAKG